MSYEDLIRRAEGLLEEDPEAAVEIYLKAAEENPGRGEAYYGLGRAYAILEKVEEARDAFRKAAELMPHDATAFHNLGAMALRSGRLREAQEAFRRAVELKGDYTEALYALGRAYEEDGRLVDARLCFMKALRTKPGWDKVRQALGRVESELLRPGALDKYRRILLVMDQGIGNMVMLTPALRALKELLPKAEVVVLGRKPSVEVLEGLGVKAITEPEGEVSYDIGFYTIWSADYERAFGRKLREQCGGRLYKVQMDDPDLHESEHHMKIPRLMGYSGSTPEPYCALRDVDVPWGEEEKVVALSDTSLDHPAWQRKRWPYFRELAWRLVERGYKVALIGGPSEAARFDHEGWPEVYNLLGRYDISGTAGVLKKCSMFIGNDSGPAHMAGALGVPTFVLFGPTRISKNIPLGPRVRAISKNLSCSPCQYTPMWEACRDWVCMKSLDVEEVLGAIFPEKPSVHVGRARKLKLMAKSYDGCNLERREDGRLYVVGDGLAEPLKVHIIGAGRANFPWGMENEVKRTLEIMGAEVVETDYRLDKANFRDMFLREAHLAIVFKGSGIPPELIRQHPGRIALWYPDDVFVTPHGRRDIRYNSWAFDTVYTFQRSAVEEFKKYGAEDVRWLPLAMSPYLHRKLLLPPEERDKYEVSFVGTIFPNRRRLIERLRRKFPVFVTRAYTEEMVKIFNQSKIVLNLGIGPTGVQQRVFEALGCGAFLLTNEIPKEEKLFRHREHLVYFDEDNIEDLVEYYLKHEEERRAIAEAGYREAHAKHTFRHRMERILEDAGFAREERGRAWKPLASIVLRPRRRLIVFWHGIGDNIMATPALRAFRKAHPKDHIGYMYLKRIHKDKLMEGCPYVDALYTCSDAWDDHPDYETGVRAVVEEAKELARREGYDEVVPVTLRAMPSTHHRIERIAYELGVKLDSWDTELWVSEEDRRRADEIWKRWGLGEDDIVVAIHRRGANVYKYWEVEEAQKVVDHLKERYKAKVIAFETHTDLNREPAKQLEGVYSTADLPELPLKVSAALIEKCKLFIGLDSGPMWLATTTKTPIVALFTMTWMHQSAPLREKSIIVASQKAWDMATEEFKERHKDRILRDGTGGIRIGARTVLEAVERLLSEDGKAPIVISRKRYIYSPPPAFHGPGAYWGAFLTLRCSADCPYCIQRIVPEEFERAKNTKHLSGEEWVRILNGIEHRPGQPLALTGGEPSVHRDFLYILNNLEGYTVTVTTNLISKTFEDIDRFAKNLHPRSAVRFNTSFHPGFIPPEEFVRRVRRMKELGLWVDQVAMVDHPGSGFLEYRQIFSRHGLDLRPQSFLGYWNGKLYPDPEDPTVTNDPREHGITDMKLYREGFSARERKPVHCLTRRFLIAPDGLVYNCHYHLYSRRSPVGDLTKGDVNLREDHYYCEDFGFCNPCDFPHVSFKPVETKVGFPTSWAEEYDASYFWKTERRTRYVFRPMAQFLKALFEPKRVLDAGCGMGFLVKWLREYGVEAYGFDLSSYAVKHISDEPYLTPGKVDVRPYVVRAELGRPLPYRENSFDLVTSLDVFEHLTVEQAVEGIKELERITSKYIFMIITVHDDPSVEVLPKGAKGDPTHVTVARQDFWRRLFAEHTNLVRREDLEDIATRNLNKILPWTFFVYEKVLG